MSHKLKCLIVLLLLPATMTMSLPASCLGQTSAEANAGNVRASSGSSDGDEQTTNILIGLFVVVIVVLGIVSWKSDAKWMSEVEGGDHMASYESDDALSIELSAEKELGLSVRF